MFDHSERMTVDTVIQLASYSEVQKHTFSGQFAGLASVSSSVAGRILFKSLNKAWLRPQKRITFLRSYLR